MMIESKKIQLLRLLLRRKKKGVTAWEAAAILHHMDIRKRISELINRHGIRIIKKDIQAKDGSTYRRYILADPEQEEIKALLAKGKK